MRRGWPIRWWRRTQQRCATAIGVVLALGFPFVAGAETFTLATYNIANYNVSDRRTTDGFRPAYPKPEAEKAVVRRVIRELNADLIVLQEIGGAEFLLELQRDLRSEGCDYPHRIVAEAADEVRRIGALSRRPFLAHQTHADLEFDYRGGREQVRRGLLELRLATGAGELAVFVVHLKSRYTDRADDPLSSDLRQAEATAVRERILQRIPGPTSARLILAGDFNDGPRSGPLQTLQGRGQRRLLALTEPLDARGHRWTHWYRRDDTYSRVDHILVSPELAGQVTKAWINDDPEATLASDHRAVAITLKLTPPDS